MERKEKKKTAGSIHSPREGPGVNGGGEKRKKVPMETLELERKEKRWVHA